MKEKDVYVDYDQHQLLLYVEQDDGTYGGLQTGAFAAKNHLDVFLAFRSKVIASGIEKLKKGEISPVAFHMDLNGMTIADVARRAGISRAKVRKQLIPSGFSTASIDELRRYAEVFNISLADFFQMIVPKKKGISLKKQKTDNPLFTIIDIV